MPAKTPGGSAASDKYKKQAAEGNGAHFLNQPPAYIPLISLLCHTHRTDISAERGEGAENAPGHTEGKAPGEAPVASDSGNSIVGIEPGTNQPGEKGIEGPTYGEKPGTVGGAP